MSTEQTSERLAKQAAKAANKAARPLTWERTGDGWAAKRGSVRTLLLVRYRTQDGDVDRSGWYLHRVRDGLVSPRKRWMSTNIVRAEGRAESTLRGGGRDA